MLSLIDVAAKLPQVLGTSPGELAGRLPDFANSLGSDSLIEYTQSTRIAPLAIVDASLAHDPSISTVLKTANMLVASYYLRAVSISLQYNNIQISSILDGLNPTRNVRDSLARSAGVFMSGNEDYSGLQLPRYDLVNQLVDTPKSAFDHFAKTALSAGNNDSNTPTLDLKNPDANPNLDVADRALTTTFHKDTVSNISNISNLAVGTLIDVIFESKNGRVSVPVQIEVTGVSTDSAGLIDIMAHAERDVSMSERWWQVRNGLISKMDFITAMDLVDAHAAALQRDKSGVYREILRRKQKNRISGFLSGMAALKKGLNGGRANGLSVATASNIIIMDKSTADQLEQTVGGSLSDFNLRSRIFANSYIMLLFVVDTQWKTVTIYHRGIVNANELRLDDMKSATGKNGNVDMLAMVEAYSRMQTPSIGSSRFH